MQHLKDVIVAPVNAVLFYSSVGGTVVQDLLHQRWTYFLISPCTCRLFVQETSCKSLTQAWSVRASMASIRLFSLTPLIFITIVPYSWSETRPDDQLLISVLYLIFILCYVFKRKPTNTKRIFQLKRQRQPENSTPKRRKVKQSS